MINKFFYKRNSSICKTSRVFPFSRIINCHIGSYSYISYSCHLNNVTIGKCCSIAKGVNIGLGFHPLNFISTSPIFYSLKTPLNFSFVNESRFTDTKSTFIGNDVWIGLNVVILDGVTIGNGAVIAANSVVNHDVEPYSIVGGVPAKEIRKRFSKDVIQLINSSKWWDLPLDFFSQKESKDIFSTEINQSNVKTLIKLISDFKKNN